MVPHGELQFSYNSMRELSLSPWEVENKSSCTIHITSQCNYIYMENDYYNDFNSKLLLLINKYVIKLELQSNFNSINKHRVEIHIYYI